MLRVRLRSDGLLETSRDDGWTVFDPGGVLVHSCPLPVPRACSRKASSSLGGERPRRSGHTTRNGRRSGNPRDHMDTLPCHHRTSVRTRTTQLPVLTWLNGHQMTSLAIRQAHPSALGTSQTHSVVIDRSVRGSGRGRSSAAR